MFDVRKHHTRMPCGMHAGMSAVRYGAVARRRHMTGEEVERRSEEEKEVLSFLFPDFFPFILLCFMNLNFPFLRFSWVVGLFISVYSNSNSALVENQRSEEG